LLLFHAFSPFFGDQPVQNPLQSSRHHWNLSSQAHWFDAAIHSEAGTPVQVIQALLGHKSATTTMLYLESHREKATEHQAKVAERMGMA